MQILTYFHPSPETKQSKKKIQQNQRNKKKKNKTNHLKTKQKTFFFPPRACITLSMGISRTSMRGTRRTTSLTSLTSTRRSWNSMLGTLGGEVWGVFHRGEKEVPLKDSGKKKELKNHPKEYHRKLLLKNERRKM